MRFQSKKGDVAASGAELLVLTVTAADLKEASGRKQKAKRSSSLDAVLTKSVRDRLVASRFKGSQGQTFTFNLPAESGAEAVMLVGWEGESRDADRFDAIGAYRLLGSQVSDLARRNGIKRVAVASEHLDFSESAHARAFIEGALLSGYSFTRYKSKRDEAKPEIELVAILNGRAPAASDVAAAERAVAATMRARDLVNMPPRDCTPTFVAKECKAVAKAQGLKIDVFDARALKKMGAGALLAVAQGSEEPPYLIRMVYSPKRKSKRSISLVGKGITFDSGGLSIKTASGMETMKCDMSGAAAVLGVMSVIKEARPDIEVRAYIPTTENMINGRATRPGDVVTAMSGKTIEILNTDAEGRLILADAITLAERDGSDVIVDLATLTGACMVALGTDYAGLFSNDDKLSARIFEAAEQAGERFWRMPLAKEYKDWIKSPVADIKNMGKPYGGAITAALFLEEFVVNARWAHLDIAGPAFTEADKGYIRRGGVGFGVRTLLNLLEEM